MFGASETYSVCVVLNSTAIQCKIAVCFFLIFTLCIQGYWVVYFKTFEAVGQFDSFLTVYVYMRYEHSLRS